MIEPSLKPVLVDAFERWVEERKGEWLGWGWAVELTRPADFRHDGRVFVKVETPEVLARTTLFDSGEVLQGIVSPGDDDAWTARQLMVSQPEEVEVALRDFEAWAQERASWPARPA